MVESCANKITSYLIKKETFDADDYELYQYAFETIVALIMQLSTVLIIGFAETLLFLYFIALFDNSLVDFMLKNR